MRTLRRRPLTGTVDRNVDGAAAALPGRRLQQLQLCCCRLCATLLLFTLLPEFVSLGVGRSSSKQMQWPPANPLPLADAAVGGWAACQVRLACRSCPAIHSTGSIQHPASSTSSAASQSVLVGASGPGAHNDAGAVLLCRLTTSCVVLYAVRKVGSAYLYLPRVVRPCANIGLPREGVRVRRPVVPSGIVPADR